MEAMETMTGDVLDINNIYGSYGDYKRALDGELQRSAESFVRIGYLLKVARDTDILQESGYGSVNDFAHTEYGLDKSQVSRFIRINDEFSENGYSDKLQERYRSFGYAKLSLMLLMPAEIRGELTADMSKAEIRAVKEEIDDERKVTDLEVMMEEKDGRQQDRSIFGKVLYRIGKDEPDLYIQLHEAVCGTVYDGTAGPVIEKLMDALAPAGEAIISVRIPGEGRKMLSIKGADIDPVVVDIRSGDKQSCTWNQLITEIESLCEADDVHDSGRESWEILYGEPFPEKKEEVAPVQPKKQPEARKTSRVTKAKKPEKTREETVPDGSETAMPASGQQETVEDKEQEAADSETKSEREAPAPSAHDDGGEQTGGHADEPEPGNDADGAAGSAGEGSACGDKDREGGTGEQDAGAVTETDDKEESRAAAGVAQETEKPGKTPAEAEAEEGVGEHVITDLDGMVQHTENQKKIMLEELEMMRMQCIHNNWDGLIKRAKDIIIRAESIRNMEETWNG